MVGIVIARHTFGLTPHLCHISSATSPLSHLLCHFGRYRDEIDLDPERPADPCENIPLDAEVSAPSDKAHIGRGRQAIIQWRRLLDPRLVQQRSNQIGTRIADHIATAEMTISTLISYVPIKGEVDPAPAEHFTRSHRIAYPRIVNDTLEFRIPLSAASMRQNRFRIPEPSGTDEIVDPATASAILIPLVMFDSRCHRMGFGAGFYDRALDSVARMTKPGNADGPIKIGLAYDEQEAPEWAPDPWDVQLDCVITPTRTLVL